MAADSGDDDGAVESGAAAETSPTASEAEVVPTGPGDDAVLATDGLVKRFGELTAVDDVTLRVRRGEFRSVIGPNGAGKTTLFNLVTGVLPPTSGAVYFGGEDVTGLAPHERVRRGMGRSFQLTNNFGGLTVRENVRLAAQSTREGGFAPAEWLLRPTAAFEDVTAAADDVLGRIGLAGQADEHASALAYGDRRRLELGIVLATDPEVVLLDEPTAGMSREETRETMALIDEALADRTLVVIEHDVDLVMNVSDRVTVLDRGGVLASGTPEEIAADSDVQAAYLGGER
jgi:branched-chain amino acid transport system ATP-binding protein